MNLRVYMYVFMYVEFGLLCMVIRELYVCMYVEFGLLCMVAREFVCVCVCVYVCMYV